MREGGTGTTDTTETAPLWRRAATALALLALIAVGGGLVRQLAGGGDGPSGTLAVGTDERPIGRTAPATPILAETLGGYELITSATIAGRAEPVTAWTGLEVLIWGGHQGVDRPLSDGAAYDPATHTWRHLPGARWGWSPRVTAVWTGLELLVVEEGEQPRAQAYDPATDTWRDVSPPPPGDWAWDLATPVGTTVVVPAHVTALDDPPRPLPALVYDSELDRWRTVPRAAEQPALVASGALPPDAALVAVEFAGGPLTVHLFAPDTDLTRSSEPGQLAAGVPLATATDNRGQRLLVSGSVTGLRGQLERTLAAWSPAQGWEELRRLAEPWRSALGPVRLIATEIGPLLYPDDPQLRPAVLTGGDEGAWRPLPDPAPLRDRIRPAVVWTDAGLLVWGGQGGDDFPSDGALFDLAPSDTGVPRFEVMPPDGATPMLTGRWRRLPAPPFGLGRTDLFPLADGMLAWSPWSGGARWHEPSRTWHTLPPSPLPTLTYGGSPPAHATAWTGRELLVWGRAEGDGRGEAGAAYEPAADRWRRLPASPLAGSVGPVGAAWTGRELLVVTGPMDKVAAAYDPAADRWRPLPAPRGVGHLVHLTWTGREALLLGDAGLLRWRPGQPEWTPLAAPPPLPTQGVAAVWTGRELLAWGGDIEQGSRRGYAFDPASGAWRPMATPWFSGVVDGSPSAWSGRFWVLGGATVARNADVTWWPIGAYEPSADRWFGLANAPRQAQPLSMTWTSDRLFVLAVDSSAWTFTPDGAVIPGDESP